MTGTTDPRGDQDVARRALTAAYLDDDEIARALSELETAGSIPGNPTYAALVAVVTGMLADGCPGDVVYQLTIDGELPLAVTLKARGMPMDAVWQIGEDQWLRHAIAALDTGIPLDIVSACRDAHLTCSDLVTLYARGLDDDLARTLVPRTDIYHEHVRIILDAGGTWDDVATAAASGLPMRTISHLIGEVMRSGHAGDATHLPSDVIMLAAIIAAGLQAGDLLDALPAAAAARDQPWLPTALTLLADQQGQLAPRTYTAFTAARTLDGTALGPPAPRTPWTPPPAPTLSGEPVAAWVERALAAAVTHGPGPAVLTGAPPDGLSPETLALGVGIDAGTVTAWNADGADIACGALLTAYGLAPDRAGAAARTDRGWLLVTLLAGGASITDALSAARAFTGRTADEMFAPGVSTDAGLPIGARVLAALGDGGGTITDIDERGLATALSEQAVPEDLAVTAAALAARLGQAQTSHPPLACLLAYATCVAGQPWADGLAPHTLTGHNVNGVPLDERIELAGRIVTARTQHERARRIAATRAPSAPPRTAVR